MNGNKDQVGWAGLLPHPALYCQIGWLFATLRVALLCQAPESQKPRWRVGITDQKVFAHPEFFAFLALFRTFGLYMSQKQFTHSVRKVFAREILPTGKFWIFVSLPGTLVKAMLMLGCYVDRSASRPHVFARAHFLLQPTTPFCVHPTHNLATHQIVHC